MLIVEADLYNTFFSEDVISDVMNCDTSRFWYESWVLKQNIQGFPKSRGEECMMNI